MSRERLDLLVVGGGLSGLAAAWRAHAAGKTVALLEASPRVGGVIRTDSIGPYRVERAAASFPSSARHLLALHAAVPGTPAMRTSPDDAQRQFLWTRRGLVAVERSPTRFSLSGILPPSGVVRLAMEPLFGRRRAGGPETMHALVRRRFGRETAERLLRPMTLGIYGSDPRELGAADAFPTIAAAERLKGSLLPGILRMLRSSERRVATFEGGMESFPRAIAAALGDRVKTGVSVVGVTADASGPTVRASDGSALAAKEVLLATTATEQRRLVAPLSPAAAGILSAVRYAPMVVVAVGIAPGGAPPLPRAFGFLRAPGSRARILGASFASVLDPTAAPEGHALVTVYLGGGTDPSALDLSDDAVTAVALADLGRALRGSVRPDLVSVMRWPRAIPVFSPGHRARMAEARRLVAPHGLDLSGSHVKGVSVDACCAPV